MDDGRHIGGGIHDDDRHAICYLYQGNIAHSVNDNRIHPLQSGLALLGG
jgi:hypothetical protein